MTRPASIRVTVDLLDAKGNVTDFHTAEASVEHRDIGGVAQDLVLSAIPVNVLNLGGIEP